MKIESKLNRKSTISKALLAGTSLAMLSFFTPSVWAAGAVDVADYDSEDAALDALKETTLTSLAGTDYTYVDENDETQTGTYSADLSSAYTLTALTDAEVESDVENGEYTGSTYDIVIKKYLDNGDGTYATKYYAVQINTLGTGSNTIYFAWTEDDYGNLTLTTTDVSGSALSASNSDFAVNYDASATDGSSYTASMTSGYSSGSYVFATKTTATSVAEDFANNSLSVSANIYGGIVYAYNTSATVKSITADFISNSISGVGTYIYGGLIYNSKSPLASITGDFIDNSVTSSATVNGGLIYSVGSSSSTPYLTSITGDFIGNSVSSTSTSGTINGGLIFHSAYSNLNSITGDFIGNTVSGAKVYGGVLYNYSGTGSSAYAIVDLIAGDFVGNIIYATNGYAQGGAIYNAASTSANTLAYIGLITGDFIGNIAYSSSSYAQGGAIYNASSGTTTSNTTSADIGTIVGDFIGNIAYSAASGMGLAQGGAIYNASNICDITVYGDFIDNSAISLYSSASGGAIRDYCSSAGSNITVYGDFIGNSAIGTVSYMYGGGAIFTQRGNIWVEGNFVDNESSGFGGAISNTNGTVTLYSSTGNDYYYVGNTAGTYYTAYIGSSLADSYGGFAYLYSTASSTTYLIFDTEADSSITIGDGTTGQDSIASNSATNASYRSIVMKTGEGTLTVNSSMSYFTGILNVEEGTMIYANTSYDMSAAEIIIGDNSDETAEAFLVLNASTLKSTSSLTLNADGTLVLTGGILSLSDLTISSGATINTYDSLTLSSALTLVEGSTFNAYGVVSGDIDATDADVNAIITGDNAGETIFTGTLTGVSEIDVSIGDIGASLGTETIVYSDTTNTDIVVTVDSAYTGYVSVDYDANTVKIGSSIAYTDEESGASIDVSLDTDSNIVAKVTSDVDYTVSDGDTQTIDYISTDTSSSVVLDGGTINTGGSMVLASDEENKTSYLQVSSGTIETTSDDASVVLLNGTTSITEGETFEIIGNISVGDTESEVSSTLGSADSTLVLTDTSVSIAENSSLSLVSTTISGDDATFTGEDGSTLALGSVSASTTISLNSLDTVSSDTISSTASTALSLSETTLDGASVEFSASDEAKTAVEITDESSVISGEVSTTYTSTSEDASSTDLTAIKTATGTIILDDQTTVSALLTDTNGDEIKATALTNVAGTGGLTVNLLGEATINGNIVANSPFILNAGTYTDTNAVESTVENAKLTVTGSISTGDDESSDDVIITDATLLLTGEDASLSTYYDNDGNDEYGNMYICGTGAFEAENGADVVVGTISVAENASLSLNASTLSATSIANDGSMYLTDMTFSTDVTGTGSISTSGEVTATSSIATGTLTVTTGSTFNLEGTLSGSVVIESDADFNIYITEANVESAILTGDISSDTDYEVDIYLNNIATLFNTTITIYDNSYALSNVSFVFNGSTLSDNTVTVGSSITMNITDSYENTGKVYFTENSGLVTADIVTSVAGTVVYYELNEGDEQTIDKINEGSDTNSTGYLVLSGGTLNTTNTTGNGMEVNNDTYADADIGISTGKLILESGTINLVGVLSFDDGETTIGSVEIVGGTTKLGIFANSQNEGKSSIVKLESDSTLYFNSADISLREDSTISAATDATDTTLIIEDATLASLENENVTPEDYILTISDITTVSIGNSTFDDLTVTFDGIDSLDFTNVTFSENAELSLNLVGTDLTLTDTSLTGTSITMTTDADGNMSTIETSGTASLEDNSVTVSGSASMLVGSVYTISSGDILDAVSDLANYAEITKSEGSTIVTIDSLTYFQETQATNSNEMELAVALDSITADGEVVGDTAYNAKVAFKVAAEANGLSSYIMSANSYIAEVDTMLLSNMNFANVNRARSILEKSAGIQLQDEDGSISLENEDGTISVVDADSVSLIKYSNVAQLQSINLLGSKSASNGVAGYDYWSVGSTANFDEILSENALVGVSIGGTYNKVEGDAGDNANSTTFLLNFYGVYAYEGFEAFANIGYAHFWNEGSKSGASADWDSDAFNFLVGVSYDLATNVEGLTITPVAMLNLVCLDADSASYSNGVTVDSESYFSAKLMLGFEVEYAVTEQFNVLARAMYSHECGDTSYDNTYSLGFVNGVNYIGSEAGADSAVMGLGLSYDFSETCTAYFDYNAYAYSNLITHSLNLSVALKF